MKPWKRKTAAAIAAAMIFQGTVSSLAATPEAATEVMAEGVPETAAKTASETEPAAQITGYPEQAKAAACRMTATPADCVDSVSGKREAERTEENKEEGCLEDDSEKTETVWLLASGSNFGERPLLSETMEEAEAFTASSTGDLWDNWKIGRAHV